MGGRLVAQQHALKTAPASPQLGIPPREMLAQMQALRQAFCKECVRAQIPSSTWTPPFRANAATARGGEEAAGVGGGTWANWRGGFVPVFVVGMPRSGTTLIEQMLGNHPLVTANASRQG